MKGCAMVLIKPQAKTYDLQNQLELSRLRDSEIDKHFSDSWHIQKVGRDFERAGIDRIWTHKTSGRRWTVEYKHDTLAHKTGNVFVEVESVEGSARGWAYTSCARVVVYYVVGGEYAFVTRMDEIERKLPWWEATFPKKHATTLNKGRSYKTHGVLVPLMIYRASADKVCPVFSGDEPTAEPSEAHVIPLRRGSGVLQ